MLLRLAGHLVGDVADAQLGQQGSVSGQDSQISLAGRDCHLIHHAAEQLPFRSDDYEVDFFR